MADKKADDLQVTIAQSPDVPKKQGFWDVIRTFSEIFDPTQVFTFVGVVADCGSKKVEVEPNPTKSTYVAPVGIY
jgi:hypothetical protein